MPSGFENESEEKYAIKSFISKNKITISVTFDIYMKVSEKFGVSNNGNYEIPKYFILDKNGVILFRTGDYLELNNYLMKLK